MKSSTIALIITYDHENPLLLDTLSDEREIQYLELALNHQEPQPLQRIYEMRQVQEQQENEFGDYIEELLSQPFVNSKIRQHGLAWLKSKIRMEQYEKTEQEAAKVISEFAYKIFINNPAQLDFILSSSSSQVRIRIFLFDEGQTGGVTRSRAA